MDLDLNRLRVFHAVACAQSFTRAAQRLHVTQSAVSHAIRKLEEDVGETLVERQGRRFALTPAGRALQESCQRIFAEVERAQQRLRGEGPGSRPLVLGATVEFGTTVLVGRLGPFLVEHPEIHLDFHFSHHLAQPLLQDEIDLAVDCRPHPHPAVVGVDMFRERWTVIASPAFLAAHPLSHPRELGAVPVLSLDGEGDWWLNFLRALPPGERPVLARLVVVNHVRGIINAAMAGLGVGLAPTYSVLPELADGRLVVPWPDLRLLEDRFRIYRKRSRADDPALSALTAYLLSLDPGELGGAISRPDEL